MPSALPPGPRRHAWHALDPRRSLMAGIVWLVVALAASFSISAALWVGRLSRASLLQQHVRRLSLETDQLGSDVSQALVSRLGAVRAAGAAVAAASTAGRPQALRAVFEQLVSAYPEMDWLALADASGTIVMTRSSLREGSRVADSAWFGAGLREPWIGSIVEPPAARGPAATPGLGDMACALKDANGQVLGVIVARLSWRWLPNHQPRLIESSDPRQSAQALLLDAEGEVLAGAGSSVGRRWAGVPVDEPTPGAASPAAPSAAPRFERLPDGRTVLVARAPLSAGAEISPRRWQVQLSEPREAVYLRADALGIRILWVSLGLGAAAALLGALGARHLTGRLRRLTLSAAAVGRNELAQIEVPEGHDEVATLAESFAGILDDLRRERSELQALSSELERRVAVRTREVERLAAEARYAAVVRERLKIARDLHDTLAHSMMAMLSEVRLLRRMQAHDPSALPEELARAEQVAHDGLREARTAITQMRVNAVRDTGLGAALARALDQFVNRTGLTVQFAPDTEAARFGDERAETVFRIAEEALRNVERHALASRVAVTLRVVAGTHLELSIADDGIGFDATALHPGHYGLVGLREQANLIGAELDIRSAPNHGTTLKVALRIAPEAVH